MSVTTARNFESGPGSMEDPHYGVRCDLAAAFRWCAREGMNEAVGNHFSFAVNEDGNQFLINPMGRHFSSVKASELLLIDANDPETINRPGAPDPTAWYIHGAMHRNVPHGKCVLHVHPHYATVLASLKDSTLPPIDQNAMRFFRATLIDEGFDGMGLGDEAERLTRGIQDHRIVVMGNHGVMAIADNIALAFDELYYFERACRNYVHALQTGMPLKVVSDEVAEKTRQQWRKLDQVLASAHLREIREILDREEPDYAA